MKGFDIDRVSQILVVNMSFFCTRYNYLNGIKIVVIFSIPPPLLFFRYKQFCNFIDFPFIRNSYGVFNLLSVLFWFRLILGFMLWYSFCIQFRLIQHKHKIGHSIFPWDCSFLAHVYLFPNAYIHSNLFYCSTMVLDIVLILIGLQDPKPPTNSYI